MAEVMTKQVSMFHFVITLLFLSVCNDPAIAASVGRADWRELIEQGEKLQGEGRFSEAEQSFVAAIRAAEELGSEHPRYASALNGLATFLRRRGRYAEVENLLRRAVSILEHD